MRASLLEISLNRLFPQKCTLACSYSRDCHCSLACSCSLIVRCMPPKPQLMKLFVRYRFVHSVLISVHNEIDGRGQPLILISRSRQYYVASLCKVGEEGKFRFLPANMCKGLLLSACFLLAVSLSVRPGSGKWLIESTRGGFVRPEKGLRCPCSVLLPSPTYPHPDRSPVTVRLQLLRGA